MIDLPTQKEMNSPHHRRAIWALVGSGLILGAILTAYYIDQVEDTSRGQGGVVRLQSIVGQSVPPANLTNEQMAKLRTTVGQPVPKSNLTAAQLENLRKLQAR